MPIYQISALVFNLVTRKSSKQIEFLNDQAEKRKGKVLKGLLRFPRMEFFQDDIRITTCTPRSSILSSSHTQAKAESPSFSNLELSIYKKTRWPDIIESILKPTLITGDAFFDLQYVVKGSDEVFMQDYLSNEIRKYLLHEKHKEVLHSIRIRSRRFEYTIHDLPSSSTEYDEFIDTAILLCEQLKKVSLK
jgi:hypothetical protein